MLSKEKCENALHDIKMANDYPISKYNDTRVIDLALDTFGQLIQEHFNSQPCKFEDLKEGMYLFD